jgi:hypothetical protein
MFLGLDAGVWIVLVVGGLVGVALVAILSRLDSKIKPSTGLQISTVVGFLKSQEKLLESLLGEKYAPVYQAILDALKSLVDSNVTREEALIIVNDTLNAALKAGSAELTEDQRKVVDVVIETVVGLVINEPVASATALTLM